MTRSELAKKETFTIEDLFEIVSILRAEDGCPWDRVQTHASLRGNLSEEAYEAAEGIDKNDPEILKEELGDLLLQIVFHCGIAEDEKEFQTADMIGGICRKMIRRHPHIFGEKGVSGDLQAQWDEIKKKEKGSRTLSDVLNGVAISLPALMRAEKFAEKRERAHADVLPEIKDLNEKEAFGEALYRLSYEGVKKGLSPEECLQAYLAKNGANSTKEQAEI